MKGIIFDMDGVLFDTEPYYYQRRVDFLATKGLSVAHLEPAIFVGGRVHQVWQLILGEQLDQWDVAELEKEYRTYKDQHPVPYVRLVFSDAQAVLHWLTEEGIKLALASNTDRQDIDRALSESGLASYFTAVFSGMDCKAGKPDPEVYEKAATALGFSKAELLVVEDSPKGIQAGKAAGLQVWAIEDKQIGLDQSQADRKIESLSQLKEYMKRA